MKEKEKEEEEEKEKREGRKKRKEKRSMMEILPASCSIFSTSVLCPKGTVLSSTSLLHTSFNMFFHSRISLRAF